MDFKEKNWINNFQKIIFHYSKIPIEGFSTVLYSLELW